MVQSDSQKKMPFYVSTSFALIIESLIKDTWISFIPIGLCLQKERTTSVMGTKWLNCPANVAVINGCSLTFGSTPVLYTSPASLNLEEKDHKDFVTMCASLAPVQKGTVFLSCVYNMRSMRWSRARRASTMAAASLERWPFVFQVWPTNTTHLPTQYNIIHMHTHHNTCTCTHAHTYTHTVSPFLNLTHFSLTLSM